jgi:signal transduction histidine kinase
LKFIDHGTGISKKDQSRIFEAFERGEKAVSEQIEGNGVGLNLVKRIVIQHGGTITLESSGPYGSIFTIILPIYQNPEEGKVI